MQKKRSIWSDKRVRSFLQFLAWAAGIICLVYAVTFLIRRSYDIMKQDTQAGYIPKPEAAVEDGKMTPEVLLSFGRISDPQISPDGSLVLYNVSYTSVEENKSCSNLYVCRPDGSWKQQLTASASSISNARWCDGGRRLMFLREGQIWTAEIRHVKDGLVLRKEEQV